MFAYTASNNKLVAVCYDRSRRDAVAKKTSQQEA